MICVPESVIFSIRERVSVKMEIKLDSLYVGMDVAVMRANAAALTMEGLTTEISGQSEALEKFVSVYGELSKTLSEYLAVLENDMQSVSEALDTIVRNDNEQCQSIGTMGRYSMTR